MLAYLSTPIAPPSLSLTSTPFTPITTITLPLYPHLLSHSPTFTFLIHLHQNSQLTSSSPLCLPTTTQLHPLNPDQKYIFQVRDKIMWKKGFTIEMKKHGWVRRMLMKTAIGMLYREWGRMREMYHNGVFRRVGEGKLYEGYKLDVEEVRELEKMSVAERLVRVAKLEKAMRELYRNAYKEVHEGSGRVGFEMNRLFWRSFWYTFAIREVIVKKMGVPLSDLKHNIILQTKEIVPEEGYLDSIPVKEMYELKRGERLFELGEWIGPYGAHLEKEPEFEMEWKVKMILDESRKIAYLKKAFSLNSLIVDNETKEEIRVH
jgi:hypothetical protein